MFLFFRKPLGLFNCCISAKSDISSTKICREMIGSPTDFKHVLHLDASGANSEDLLLEFFAGANTTSSPMSQNMRFDAKPIVVG